MDKKLFNEFVKYLSACKNPKDIEEFLMAILTPKELAEIPRRLQIIKLLRRGMPQREIASTLGVGIATVTRGSVVANARPFREL